MPHSAVETMLCFLERSFTFQLTMYFEIQVRGVPSHGKSGPFEQCSEFIFWVFMDLT